MLAHASRKIGDERGAARRAGIRRAVHHALLTRNVVSTEDLVDQLSIDAKSAWPALVAVGHFGKEGKPEAVIPRSDQESLAEMIGTTALARQLFHEQFASSGSSSTTAV